MKQSLNWHGWERELTPRAVRLLIIAALLGTGMAANSFAPSTSSLHLLSSTLTPRDSARSDSLLNLIGVPAEPARPRTLSRRNYRRSAQMQFAIEQLRQRDLLLPLPGLTPQTLHDSFDDLRGDGARRHFAVDIAARRGTPVLSVDDGRVLKLHRSRAGGISVYAADASENFIFFYAHLDAYHPGLQEGMALQRGDTIGYVGTTGNAPPNTPHLHFQILKTTNLARWSRGTPINPVEVFGGGSGR